MAGWIPVPVDGWPEVAELLTSTARPWPESAVVADLRWHVDQGVGIPGRAALSSRWGWPVRRVIQWLGKPELWADPRQSREPVRTRHAVSGLARSATCQRRSSDVAAMPTMNASNIGATISDVAATDQRRSSLVDPQPQPPSHPELQKESARVNRSLDCSEAIARCAELAGAGPLAGASGITGTTLRRICDARREGYSVADLELLWAWGDTAPEADLARQRSGVARWGWLLAAQRDDRIEASRAWDRAGRPTGATRSDQGGGHLRAFAEMLREAEAEEAAEQARNQPGRLYVVEG